MNDPVDPQIVKLANEAAAEIARLRAEVERLMQENEFLLADDPKPTSKFLRKRTLHKKLVQQARGIEHLKREREEALDMVQKALTCGQHEGYKMVWCSCCIEVERNQARALLDRLRRAEAVVEAAEKCALSLQWLLKEIDLPKEMLVVQTCYRSVTVVCEALAAWEEGKGP